MATVTAKSLPSATAAANWIGRHAQRVTALVLQNQTGRGEPGNAAAYGVLGDRCGIAAATATATGCQRKRRAQRK
jgi:hypothetical protein